MKNLEKYLSLLNGEVDGLLLTSRYSRHYGAEFDIAEGVAIVTKNGCRYFTDSRYIESAENNIKGFEVLGINQFNGYFARLNDAIADFGVSTLGYEENYLTVAVGFATDEMKKVYDVVLKAQESAIAATKAGVPGKEIDAVARKVITDAGYGENFGHGYGHSLGLEIHEAPNTNTSNPEPMPVGAVCSAEPGIYLPGKFGVRIEDVVIIKEDGCEDITKSPKHLIVV